MEKVSAHNPTDKEIAREKKDDKKTEAEMRANVDKAEHRGEKEQAKQTGHRRTDNIGGGNDLTGGGTPETYDPAQTGRTGRDYV
uniref:Lea-like protein n=1 Tax=Picea glauca TaxID=3330 RepID=Q40841_PICGL|nr:lea-like protein [Picea glauca]